MLILDPEMPDAGMYVGPGQIRDLTIAAESLEEALEAAGLAGN